MLYRRSGLWVSLVYAYFLYFHPSSPFRGKFLLIFNQITILGRGADARGAGAGLRRPEWQYVGRLGAGAVVDMAGACGSSRGCGWR